MSINKRVAQYLRLKDITLRQLSAMSGVSGSTISRFCNGGAISSNHLQHILQVCDDLSLDWLFYGKGPMLKSEAGTEAIPGEDTLLMEALAEKDRVISERDKVISERDQTIRELLRHVRDR